MEVGALSGSWQEKTEAEIPKFVILLRAGSGHLKAMSTFGILSQVTKYTEQVCDHFKDIPNVLHGYVLQIQLLLGRFCSQVLACLKLSCMK